ncbi:MAG TPA: hypothetical protein VGD66_07470 [Allosphingosinicella sp.]|jgi:hypothetical protein
MKRINSYITQTGVSATRLGREAIGDPRLVFDLRAGRTLRPPLEKRLLLWLEAREAEIGGRAWNR